MTAASAVSAVRERLEYLLLDEEAPARCTGDLRDKVFQLRQKLESVIAILDNDGEAGENSIAISRESKKQISRLAYSIEDSIESYARKETESKARPGLLRCFLDCSAAKTLKEDLRIFGCKIDSINLTPAGSDAATWSRRTTGEESISDMHPVNPTPAVGMEEDLVGLMDVVFGGPSKLQVISICGMGGSGKTTLAQRLYQHPSVRNHFDRRAWVTVGVDSKARPVLEAILFSLSLAPNSIEEITELETMQLMERLYKAQKGRRYLVVLDDVWSIEAWETIRFAFPDDCNGSRVVITSRMRLSFADHIHEMKLLNDDESWMLFKSRLQDQGMLLNPELEAIARQIVRNCRGLPLATIVVSGLLRRMEPTTWNIMLHKQQGYQNLIEGHYVSNILDLSYDQLSCSLKPCYLYLGNFPPDEAILVENLYLLWMAEGLIPNRYLNYRERLKTAEDYLNELASRNLVSLIEMEEMTELGVKSCRLHDLLRDLCISKAEQEEFFEVVEFGHEIKGSPRISVYLNKFEDGYGVLSKLHEVRTVLFFDRKESQTKDSRPAWLREFTDLKEFQLIRVLHFDGVDFRIRTIPRGIEKLLLLRYLSFQGCYLQELPSSFGNFRFLETLDLRIQALCVMTIPNVLRKMLSLRHLYFPVAFMTDTNDKLKLDSLKKLEVLENFHAGVCDTADLLQLENLNVLTGVVDGNHTDLENIISFMNKTKGLFQTSLVVKKFDSYSEARISIITRLLQCDSLNALYIEGYLGEYPCREGMGSNFTEITLNGSELNEDPMSIFGNLPRLRRLALCNDAYLGKNLVCLEGCFLELRSLELVTLQCLEEWEMEMGSMPRLTNVTIAQCTNLEMLPDCLLDAPCLRELKIGSMPKEFQENVRNMVDEQLSYGNDHLSVNFYDC